ncbi:MAG: M14 family zinc carboxypeptidase, partial [bacterium]
EDRDIYLVTLGAGRRSVLMWSQMHGNEPTATNALLDVFAYLLRHKSDAFAREILTGLKIYAIPMLNPDGTEYDQRRNAQGIDINRDARELASPEARILKSVRDRLQPDFGFNLHDQNGRRTVGKTKNIVSIALLAPPVDASEKDTPKTIEAKKVASVICHALSPYLSGHIARYDASFMPRSFGENIQIAGTRTVLIESGGWYGDDPAFLVKMNFIAILEACHAVAASTYSHANPVIYENLPQNDQELFDLLVRNATIYDGIRDDPFTGDIGINYTEMPVENGFITRGRITDIGDMGIFAAKESIDANGLVALPGLIGLLDEKEARKALEDSVNEKFLKKGYTTLVIAHRFCGDGRLKDQIKKLRQGKFTINLGFVVPLQNLIHIPVNEQATILGDALFDGALAVLDGRTDSASLHPLTKRVISWLNRNIISEEEIRAEKSWPDLLSQAAFQKNLWRAEKLGLHERGRIRIGDFADIVFYRTAARSPKPKIPNSKSQIPTSLPNEQRLQKLSPQPTLKKRPEIVLVNGCIAYSVFKAPSKSCCGNLLVR